LPNSAEPYGAAALMLLRPPHLQRPTEAINGRLEALRRNALGFRNLTHYRLRSLLHCGNLIQQIDAL